MADTASAPLAHFLINRNKELEQQISDLQEETGSVDNLETSLRYTRGLLTNYVELNKESEHLLLGVQKSHNSLYVKTCAGGLAAAALAVAVVIDGFTRPNQGEDIMFIMFAAIVLASFAWLVSEMCSELSAVAGSIDSHVKSVANTERSNHLFSDILDPLLSTNGEEPSLGNAN
jgi:hypothetical protein